VAFGTYEGDHRQRQVRIACIISGKALPDDKTSFRGRILRASGPV